MNHPITDVIVMVLILISVVLLVVEETWGLPDESPVRQASYLITWVFAVELSARFIVAKKKSRFFRRYWPDLLALLPLLRPLRFFRFFRLFRLFRLFQLGLLLDRRVAMLRGLLRVNFHFLWALVVLTVILVVGGGTIGFILEPHVGNSFDTMQHTLWWAVYTVISGEPVGALPTTNGGRVLLAVMMLSGMSLFAVFTGIVSATMIDRLQGMTGVWEMDIDELEGHLVIYGFNSGVRPLLMELARDAEVRGQPILLVNELEHLPDLSDTGLRPEMIYHLHGDYTQVPVLEESGVKRARRAIVIADNVRSKIDSDRDARSVLCALTIERLHPDIYCVVELVDAAHRETLTMGHVEVVIMRAELAGRALASACRSQHVMDAMMNLLTLREGEHVHRVPGPKDSLPFGELLSALKAHDGVLVIGVEFEGETTVNPASDFLVTPDHHLLIITHN